MAAAPELIPEGELTLVALWYLAALCGVLFAIGIIYLLRGFIDGLFWILRKIVSNVSFGLFNSFPGQARAQQAISSALGNAIEAIAPAVGHSWHQLARQVDHVGRELYGLAQLMYTIANFIAVQTSGPALVHDVLWLERAIAALPRDLPRLWARLRALEASTVATVDSHALPRLRTIEHELDHVFTPELRTLRERVKALEDGATDVFKWVRAHPLSLGSAAFAGAVAWALVKLGAGWIRCNPFQKNSKALCGSHPGWWEDLLAGAVLIVGTVSVVDFIKDAQAVERDALDALSLLIREMPKA